MLIPKLPSEGTANTYTLFKASTILNITLGLFICALIGLYIYSVSMSISGVMVIYSVILIGLLILVVNLSILLLTRIREAHRHALELENFKSFVDSLHHALTEEDIYRTLHSFMSGIYNVDKVCLYYHSDNITGDTVWKSVPEEDALLTDMFCTSCSYLNDKDCYIAERISEDSKCLYQFKEYKKGSYACFVIKDSEHSQAILQLFSKGEETFNREMLSRINSYIEIFKPVMKSKRALYILDKKASTDNLTNLYNRGFLDSYLENQLEAADLSGQQLSIIMLDLDFFKSVNDTYGHSVGDYVLVHFSELVVGCVRKSDLAARYGGDEFIIILPYTDTRTAEVIGERIRQTLSTARIPPIDGIDIPALSCSIGISTYPAMCSDKISLLKTADIALYEAKHSGRNCTRVYNTKHKK